MAFASRKFGDERDWKKLSYRRRQPGDPNLEEYVDWENHTTTSPDDIGNSPQMPTQLSKSDQSLKKEGKSINSRSQFSSSHRGSSAHEPSPLPLEWYSFRNNHAMMGFDLELWWRRSPFTTRMIALIVALLLVISIIQLIVGIWLIVTGILEKIRLKNPYICDTSECRKASTWLTQSMNTTMDPCENFYEFVCGNYEESDKESNILHKLLHYPAFKIEFGKDSILAKILKNYKGDSEYDQPITYYKACLHVRHRKEVGLTAFKETIHQIFDINDISTFQSSRSAQNMEEVGAKVLQTMGHAVYLNMAFYSYPYVKIMEPTVMWTKQLNVDKTKVTPDMKLLEALMEKIMIELGVPPNSQITKDMTQGIFVIKFIMDELISEPTWHQIHVSDDPPPPGGGSRFMTVNEFQTQVRSKLAGLCPPMGQSLNILKVFQLFTNETLEHRHLIAMTDVSNRYFLGLDACFTEAPSKFDSSKFPATSPKAAFVGPWVFGVFFEFVEYMDSNLFVDWNINEKGTIIQKYLREISLSLEYQCLKAMWKTLGYLPSVRFFTSNYDDPDDFIQEAKQKVQELYQITSDQWKKLPKDLATEVKFLGNVLFKMGLEADILMPLVGGTVDGSPDPMNLSDDHLHNSIISLKHTVEKARLAWARSTGSSPVIKWWGNGEPRGSQILSMELPTFYGAQLQPVLRAAQEGKYKQFLGRDPVNYILFPLTLFNEPHANETLVLEHAGITYKIVRTILSILEEAFDFKHFGIYESNGTSGRSVIHEILDYTANPKEDKHKCRYINLDNPDHAYTSIVTDSTEFCRNEKEQPNFLSGIAVKISLDSFLFDRDRLLKLKYDWSLTKKQMMHLKHRQLPGAPEKYSDEQMFFMIFVRHLCRKSWKQYRKGKEARWRYKLEAAVLNALVSVDEFSDAWKCPTGSFMNLGKETCVN